MHISLYTNQPTLLLNLVGSTAQQFSNSKAAQGLLVYLEVSSIFTAIAISLSQSQRQLLYRYVIHARPHLTAKAFRYLRTLTLRPLLLRGFLQYHLLKQAVTSSQPAEIQQRSHSIHRLIIFYAKCFVLIKQSYNTLPCFFMFTDINQLTSRPYP